jgi:uncharacterized protein YPO0396
MSERHPEQAGLLYLPGAHDGSTQWRAETLQMVNWGGFHGLTRVTFSPVATLLSGASGTGKSTLLDAYLALMMPSDTPFNGASNDAITGRARSVDQRNLISYLRGKTDVSRETGTDELTDQVLRGRDSSTWGAIAMTFIDDRERRFTAMRLYFVPAGATRFDEIVMKMATIDGHLHLSQMEPLAAGRFDKRDLKREFPTIDVPDSYSRFAQTLYTKLGIGANGEGSKALRLLARIQAGHQVRTVDDLYKSMVIEIPSTYAAADRAVEHFADLEAAYEAMLTEAAKEKVLARLPDLWTDREAALAQADLIDTFGITRSGDSPFLLWALTREDALLETAEEHARTERNVEEAAFRDATEEELRLTSLIREVETAQHAAGGATISALDDEIARLGLQRDTVFAARQLFDSKTNGLPAPIDSETDFSAAQAMSATFMETFDARVEALAVERTALGAEQYPLMAEKTDLTGERESLHGRDGRVPKPLHDARLAVAHAALIDPDDLSFVAELIDLHPEQTEWRKAAETTLHGLARVLLVDEALLEQVSRAIDPIRLPIRLNFEGVPVRDHHDIAGNPALVSGKLVYKNSRFSGWLADRLAQANTDALCVGTAADLPGGGRRVTRTGQMRQGRSGSHGDYNTPNIIGFSNVERLAEIDDRLTALEEALTSLDARTRDLAAATSRLHEARAAHQHILDLTWKMIDYEDIDRQASSLTAERQRILNSNDVLRALNEQETDYRTRLTVVSQAKYGAQARLTEATTRRDRLIDRKDTVAREMERIIREQTVTVNDDQSAYLTGEFARVGDPTDLDRLKDGLGRLRERLADQSRDVREKARRATDTLTGIFQTYQDRWPNPDLGIQILSYDGYRAILDEIVSTGLHERRQEWSRRLAEWSGQDLVPLAGAFETSVEEIEDRLRPVNTILAGLPFGAQHHRLKIDLRRLHKDDITKWQRELRALSSGATTPLGDDEVLNRFKRLRTFIASIRTSETGGNTRDYYLDVRKHVVITAVAVDANGKEQSTYAALGGKSGGETQELVAFIVGAALRFQLGDEDSVRPRFAPVFLDEGFVKSDSEFAGRAVQAWKGLGFQLVIGAPLDKVTALEPHVSQVLTMTKSPKGYSHITEITSATPTDDEYTLQADL